MISFVSVELGWIKELEKPFEEDIEGRSSDLINPTSDEILKNNEAPDFQKDSSGIKDSQEKEPAEQLPAPSETPRQKLNLVFFNDDASFFFHDDAVNAPEGVGLPCPPGYEHPYYPQKKNLQKTKETQWNVSAEPFQPRTSSFPIFCFPPPPPFLIPPFLFDFFPFF